MPLLPPGRYQLVRVATPNPPSIPPRRGLCAAPGPARVLGWVESVPWMRCEESHSCAWGRHAVARRLGLVHPPSVSSRTAADERRQAASVLSGRRIAERSRLGPLGGDPVVPWTESDYGDGY